MTPLAYQALYNQFFDQDSIVSRTPDLRGIHCFETSEIVSLAEALTEKVGAFETFLPAPKIWIEYRTSGYSYALLLLESGNSADVWLVHRVAGVVLANFQGSIGLLKASGDIHPEYHYPELEDDCAGAAWAITRARENLLKSSERSLKMAIALLAAINSPKIIGRRQVMPHRGIERRLKSMMRRVGKFPLHAWTEITLKLARPKIAGEEVHEAHLTGQRALHFCRAHLRIRYGQLEYVSSHWRGDAAIGIKQSRYKVVA